jgi:phytoene dehydrogenase-like protein
MRELHCVEDESGRRLHLPCTAAGLRESLLAAAPEDARRVRGFVRILEDFGRFRPPLAASMERRRLRGALRSARSLAPVWRHLPVFWGVPLRDWAFGFRSRRLREAFVTLYPIPDFPVLAMFSSLGWALAGQVGRPVGGSTRLVEALADEYTSLGGKLCCGSAVERVIVEDDRARGVRLAGGAEHRADVVVSAADGRSTVFDMLGGRYAGGEIERMYRTLPVFDPVVLIHVGVERDLGAEPPSVIFPVRPFRLFGRTVRRLNVHHGRAPWAAPPGHTLVRVGIDSDYDPWARLHRDRARYRELKARLAGEVVERLEERYPGLGADVRTRDVATPVTMQRITLNWRGAYEGFRPTTETFGLRPSHTLPGLGGFYMTGQWVEPGGGIPGVLYNARHTMALVARHAGVRPPW